MITVKENPLKYVSRGGLKLEKAMQCFPITLAGSVCMDIGASTGGFTDCMLQSGAAKVYSVDVGHGQLAWKLRNDERVVCMEKTNFRYMVPSDIQDALDFASVDVSFISLTKILIPARNLLKESGRMVCLIKPQFEAGRDKVGKREWYGNLRYTGRSLPRSLILQTLPASVYRGLTYSPVKGPEGNIEYLVFLEKRRRCRKKSSRLRSMKRNACWPGCRRKAQICVQSRNGRKTYAISWSRRMRLWKRMENRGNRKWV